VTTDQIGTIGFCWGGGQSFRYATNNPKLRAAVVAYGPAPDTAAIKRIKAPVLGIYGENDERINANLPEVTAAMQSAGKTYMSEVYPGTGHGFLKPGRQGYDTPEREKAWGRILEFFRARLGK
jgi:carboxymethylenebutenolidase